jgi:cytochrome b-561 domain containing protein 2
MSRIEKIEIFINTLCHCFIAITNAYLTWYCFHVGFNELITFHVWFTTLAYQLLMSEGILAMYNQNTLTLLASTRIKKTAVHWILQALGVLFAFLGILIQIISRFRFGKPHFSSTHSIIGSELFIVFFFYIYLQSLKISNYH